MTSAQVDEGQVDKGRPGGDAGDAGAGGEDTSAAWELGRSR